MFTGIVQEMGVVAGVEHAGEGSTLRVAAPEVARGLARGRLRVRRRRLPDRGRGGRAGGSCSRRWRRRSRGRRSAASPPGDPVNLEAALRAGEPLGGTSCRATSTPSAGRRRAPTRSVAPSRSRADGRLRYVVEKGSIAVAGVSPDRRRASTADGFERGADPAHLRGHDARAVRARQPREPRGRHHREVRRAPVPPARPPSQALREPERQREHHRGRHDATDALRTVEEAIAEIRRGEMVDHRRLAGPRERGRPLHGRRVRDRRARSTSWRRTRRGLICLTLTPERCDELDLPPMVAAQRDALRHGLHGLDRGARGHRHRHLGRRPRRTRSASPSIPTTGPRRPVRPGHVFPLRARPGGVLERTGQTEAVRRPRPPRRLSPGRRDLRGHERGRHDGPRARPDDFCARARPR